ncbi:MAG: zf-HC2 domain-containing protein [Firmicutes bacterium]|nr:zf-HC2 domain-containing protein [Bacillota bacterium]
MNCKQVRENLSLYIDNLIDEEEAVVIAAHLAECSACRKEYEELLHITEILSDIPELELPDEFDARLHAALVSVNEERERVVIPVSRKKKSFAKRMSSIAAIFVVGIFAITMYNNSDQLMLDTAMESDAGNLQIEERSDTAGESYRQETSDETSVVIESENQVNDVAYSYYADDDAKSKDASEEIPDTMGTPFTDGQQAADEEPVNSNEEEDDFEDISLTDATTSGPAASRGGTTAYDKLMLLYTTDGAIFTGRDLTAVQYYTELLDQELEGTEFNILSLEKQDGIWQFEVETVSTDEEGTEQREVIVYLAQDGMLWTEETLETTTEEL